MRFSYIAWRDFLKREEHEKRVKELEEEIKRLKGETKSAERRRPRENVGPNSAVFKFRY